MSRHLLGLRDLSVTQIQHLLDLAQSYADGERPAGILAGRTLMTLFYEPSTRTEISFEDRKSTRLNSSHSQISYAVFCLKKKKKTHNSQLRLSHLSVSRCLQTH